MKIISKYDVEELIKRIDMKKLIRKYWDIYVCTRSVSEINCRYCGGKAFVTFENFYCTKCHADMNPISFMMSWHNASFENVIRLFEGMTERFIYFLPSDQMKDCEHDPLQNIEECKKLINKILDKVENNKDVNEAISRNQESSEAS